MADTYSRLTNKPQMCYSTFGPGFNIAFMTTLTKYAVQVENGVDIPEILTQARTIALSYIPGPVYISFPLDVMQEEIDDETAFKIISYW